MQTIAPTNDNIFAKPLEKESKSTSGFILSEKHVEAPKMAEVINVGEKVKSIKSRDIIAYKAYAATEITLDGVFGKDYLLIREDDVLGVVQEVA